MLLVLGILAAATLRYTFALTDSNNNAATNASMDVVETALFNYMLVNNRLPCPADITQAENTAAFGTEIEALADGKCTGANFLNSSTDPDHADALYDAATASKVAAGAIPTKALKLADKYAYDAWGRKILYAVDIRITASNAFLTYPITAGTANGTIGAIVVKPVSATGTLASAITYKAVYGLVSFGKNGHGGYVRNLGATSTRYNWGSTNTNEQKNCHCNSSATATAFDRIFVQHTKTAGSTTLTDTFDDIMRYKTRVQMTSPALLQ